MASTPFSPGSGPAQKPLPWQTAFKSPAAAGLFLLAGRLLAQAELPFPLPANAQYTVDSALIEQARSCVLTNFSTNSARLTNLLGAHLRCGPGLWFLVRKTPEFTNSPLPQCAESVSISHRKPQKLTMARLQEPDQLQAFRKAVGSLLATQGPLTIREPNESEFNTFWAVLPFDSLPGPLIVAEGADYAFLCAFDGPRVFWIDEVKHMHLPPRPARLAPSVTRQP